MKKGVFIAFMLFVAGYNIYILAGVDTGLSDGSTIRDEGGSGGYSGPVKVERVHCIVDRKVVNNSGNTNSNGSNAGGSAGANWGWGNASVNGGWNSGNTSTNGTENIVIVHEEYWADKYICTGQKKVDCTPLNPCIPQ